MPNCSIPTKNLPYTSRNSSKNSSKGQKWRLIVVVRNNILSFTIGFYQKKGSILCGRIQNLLFGAYYEKVFNWSGGYYGPFSNKCGT
jgi:hypothetical protein